MNQEIDLDINNYSLHDILSLFKIKDAANFNIEDLKQAKQIALKTHPDKSGLDSKFFVFYSKAYKLLHSMFQFKNKRDTDVGYYGHVGIYDSNINDLDDPIINSSQLNEFISSMDKNEFNSWFNKTFDTINGNMTIQNGYGDWLKSDEDLEMESNHHVMEERKKQLSNKYALTKTNDVYSNYGSAEHIGSSEPEEYTSMLFSNLQYEDLKKAHIESVVPVTEEDYNNIRKYKNVSEYVKYRDELEKHFVVDNESMKNIFYNNKRKDEEETLERAFKITREMEEVNAKKKEFMAKLLQLN